jgi:hypothetical protein
MAQLQLYQQGVQEDCGFSWSRKDFCSDGKNTEKQEAFFRTAAAGPAGIFCPDGKNTEKQEAFFRTAAAGPAGIFARMAKTQKRRERFTFATSLPLA